MDDSSKNNGYTQAVQNLAYYVIAYADRDFKDIPISDDISELHADLVDNITSNGDIAHKWKNLEEAAEATVREYGVEYSDLMCDVWAMMLEMDRHDTDYVN